MSLIWGKYTTKAFHDLKVSALTDLWAFADLINFYGGTENFDPVHRELADFLGSTRERRLILMPRGHLKSTFCSTLKVLHEIYKNPDIRIMVGTCVKELAIGFVREVKQYLEHPDLKELVWNARPHIEGNLIPDMDKTGSSRKRGRRADPDLDEEETEAADKKVVWRSNALQVNRRKTFKEPTLFAASVGMVQTGWHYDMVIFDDIVSFDNSADLEKSKKIHSWVQDIESVINPYNEKTGLGDDIIILGTRYYKWDYYGLMLGTGLETVEEQEEYLETIADDPLYVFIRDLYGNGGDGLWHPVEFEKTTVTGRTQQDGYLAPRFMTLAKERKLRRRIPKRRFYSQYFNMIVADEEIVLGWDALNWYLETDLGRDGKYWKLNCSRLDEPRYLQLFCVVDPAASLNKKADYSVITVGAVTHKNELIAVDVRYGHWSASQLAKTLMQVLEKWELSHCVIEANGTQVAIVNTIKEVWQELGFRAAITEEQPKGEKKQRIADTLEPVLANRALWLPSHLATKAELREQFDLFPSEAVRDDFPDTLEKLKRHAIALTPERVAREKARKTRRLQQRRARATSPYGGVHY